MINLLQLDENSIYWNNVLKLFFETQKFICGDNPDVAKSFFNDLKNQKAISIAGIDDFGFFGFVIADDFKYLNDETFTCSVWGASKRKRSTSVEIALKHIIQNLFDSGCVRVDIKTVSFNLPMRNLANRLGFEFKCEIKNDFILNGKLHSQRLYTKVPTVFY